VSIPSTEGTRPAATNGRGTASALVPAPHEGAPTASGELEALVRRMLELIGEDPEREGLRDTPARVRKSLQSLTRGYGQSPHEAVGSAVFQEHHGSLVLVRDIEFHSLCEHHMLPFFGRVHVGYIPEGRIVGLSKLARLVEVYARRLQVQERLTESVADALVDVLQPQAAAVIIQAQHHCMMMRGVEKQASSTVTSSWRGTFAEEPAARLELLRLLDAAD